MLSEKEVVEILQLKPLAVEGGMYKSTYTSEEQCGNAPAGTAIYYMLTDKTFSHLHRLEADEVYHHYMGDAVNLVYIQPDGKVFEIRLGSNLAAGERPQAIVPKGTWQGSRVVTGGKYALMGTTMSPGYTDAGYEHADSQKLCLQYPHLVKLIQLYTGV